SGDTNNPGPVNSGCLAEPVVITASPSITTTADPTSGGLGATLNDSATLSGTSNLLSTGSVTFYLYGPHQTCQTDGSGSPLFTQTVLAISSNGPFVTFPGYAPVGGLEAGTYHWL